MGTIPKFERIKNPSRAARRQVAEWRRMAEGHAEPNWGQKLAMPVVLAGVLGLAIMTSPIDWRPATRSPATLAALPSSGEGQAGRYFGICSTGGGIDCVVDGDTAWIGGTKVRIADIDTPEAHRPRCAEEDGAGGARDRRPALLAAGAFTLAASTVATRTVWPQAADRDARRQIAGREAGCRGAGSAVG